MSTSLLFSIIHSVKAACKKQPVLRKKAAVLARDILAVCTGLRGAIMVDYMRLTSSAMMVVLADVQAQQNQFIWPDLALLHLDGCLYLLRQTVLQTQLVQLRSPAADTVFITVQEAGGLGVASADAVKVVTTQLEAMCHIVLAAEPTSNHSCVFVDLDHLDNVPVMPTLSGWLLQYPVVYLTDCTSAVALAQLLSDAVLVLYEMKVTGAFVQDLETHFPQQSQLQSLCAFTVPEGLLPSCLTAVCNWNGLMSCQWHSSSVVNTDQAHHHILSHRLAPHRVQL